MIPDSICIKKDKRLLVLLALGALILMLDQSYLLDMMNEQISRHSWLELTGPQKSVLRLSFTASREIQVDELSRSLSFLNDNEINTLLSSIKDQQVISISMKNDKRGEQINGTTPQLAIFMGLPVAINQVNFEELVLIQGIGPYLARNILNYRQEHGVFSNTEQMGSVPGIGPKVLSKISPLLKFD